MNHDHSTFWSTSSLAKKIDLWSSDQIKNFFVPFLNLKSNEEIYDVGSGFSPLGINFIPFILPKGHIVGFDNNDESIRLATSNASATGVSQYIKYQKQDVYTIDEQNLPLADLVMCQQLLVNVADPVTALEHMINVTKTSGRIFCLENVNYGAYIYRPDFSWKANFKLSKIWQELCVKGKYGYDYGDTTFGANLPQVFAELKLHNIAWQIIGSGINVKPPYSKEFKTAFLQNHSNEKQRLKDLILTKWGPKTDLSEKKINYFIQQIVESDYDTYALDHNLFLTQWFYPIMAIVGWLNPKSQQTPSENVQLSGL